MAGSLTVFTSKPIVARSSGFGLCVFVLRLPGISVPGIYTVVSHIYAYDRAKTHSFILLIRRKSTEFENESNV